MGTCLHLHLSPLLMNVGLSGCEANKISQLFYYLMWRLHAVIDEQFVGQVIEDTLFSNAIPIIKNNCIGFFEKCQC